ncbi:MAG: hypothetical protein ACRC3J_10270 [Culicoidibacterales bacterium]
MIEQMQTRLQLASTLGKVGAILAIISTVAALISSLGLILLGSIISTTTLNTLVNAFIASEFYDQNFDALLILQNFELLKIGLIFSGIIILLIAIVYLFFEFKMLKYTNEYLHNLDHQHTIYMIIFAAFLLFSGRIFSGGLLLASGILAYTVKEYLSTTQT